MPSANDSQLFAFNFFGGKTGAVTKSGTLGWTGETPNLVNVVILIHRSLQKLLRFLCKVSSNRFSGMTLIYKWWHESFIGVKLLSTFVSRYKPHLLKLFLFHIYSTHDFIADLSLIIGREIETFTCIAFVWQRRQRHCAYLDCSLEGYQYLGDQYYNSYQCLFPHVQTHESFRYFFFVNLFVCRSFTQFPLGSS